MLPPRHEYLLCACIAGVDCCVWLILCVLCVYAQADATVKGELAELLDTLLDLQQSYPPADPRPASAHPLEQKLASLLPLLLASYGATLSSPDQSLLRVLLHINDMIFQTYDYQRSTAVAAAEAEQAAAAVLITQQQTAHFDGDMGEVRQDQGCIGRRDEDAGTGSGAGGADRSAATDARTAAPEEPGKEGEGSDGPITALLYGPLAKAGWVHVAVIHLLISQCPLFCPLSCRTAQILVQLLVMDNVAAKHVCVCEV